MLGKRLNLLFDTDDAGGSAAPPEPEVSTTPPTEKAKTTDWEAAYKGLQRRYDKLAKDLEEAKSKYDAAVEELEGEKQSHRSVSGEKDTLMKQNVDLSTQIKSLQDNEASRTLERDRYMLILGEFSDLAPFEAKGLLPPGTNLDELRQKFTDFRAALGDRGQQAVQDAFQGAGPGAVGSDGSATPKRSKDDVYDDLLKVSGDSSPEGRRKHEALMKEWIALN